MKTVYIVLKLCLDVPANTLPSAVDAILAGTEYAAKDKAGKSIPSEVVESDYDYHGVFTG